MKRVDIVPCDSHRVTEHSLSDIWVGLDHYLYEWPQMSLELLPFFNFSVSFSIQAFILLYIDCNDMTGHQSPIWLRVVKIGVPIGVIFGLAYIDFASFYSLGYQEIYKHHSKGIAVALWVLGGFSQFVMFLYWILMFVIGPGKSPVFQPLNLYGTDDPNLIPCPDIFPCDEYGYPEYNSNARSIVTARTFYLKDMGYMVLKFDHFCLWIGTVVGETNYLFFMKYCQWFLTYFVVILIFLIRYTPLNIGRGGEINHNFIPLYVMCGMWILMIGALFGTHFYYIVINKVTLDQVSENQKRSFERWQNSHKDDKKKRPKPREETGWRYINVKKDNLRLVVQYGINDRVYDMGAKKNFINLVYNGNRNHGLEELFYTTQKYFVALAILFIPFVDIYNGFKYAKRPPIDPEIGSLQERKRMEFESYSCKLNDDFLQHVYGKIERKECYIAQYIRLPQEHQKPPEDEREPQKEASTEIKSETKSETGSEMVSPLKNSTESGSPRSSQQ